MIERIVCSYSSLIRLLQFVKYIVIVFSILNFNLYGHIFPSISQKNSPDLGLFSYAVLYALYLDAVLGTLPAVGAVHNDRKVQNRLISLAHRHQWAVGEIGRQKYHGGLGESVALAVDPKFNLAAQIGGVLGVGAYEAENFGIGVGVSLANLTFGIGADSFGVGLTPYAGVHLERTGNAVAVQPELSSSEGVVACDSLGSGVGGGESAEILTEQIAVLALFVHNVIRHWVILLCVINPYGFIISPLGTSVKTKWAGERAGVYAE